MYLHIYVFGERGTENHVLYPREKTLFLTLSSNMVTSGLHTRGNEQEHRPGRPPCDVIGQFFIVSLNKFQSITLQRIFGRKPRQRDINKQLGWSGSLEGHNCSRHPPCTSISLSHASDKGRGETVLNLWNKFSNIRTWPK